ncbi:hypothetical protein F5984_20640 [Rudanella paleaurantiibacter]|uniref:Uncharacterized protein n=1 Tax=Rudanella paleaurantiibacter TaxID=2614655 RepID=A0A7J5TXK5_9BACT|nr:hypothetical protein [Rudanella paleaurantiibacter]KAB7728156.1 hypothetical protein F5984_20640 [Rudanella paleaurantiibacter]
MPRITYTRPVWERVSDTMQVFGQIAEEQRLDGVPKQQPIVAGVVRFCPKRQTYRPYAYMPNGNLFFLTPCYSLQKAKNDLIFFLAQSTESVLHPSTTAQA